MYLTDIHIKNIRSISELKWEIAPNKEAGWHVIIGDNGSGKSSFLRSIALALVGPSEAAALRQDWRKWLRAGESSGTIRLHLTYHKSLDKFADGKRAVLGPLSLTVELIKGAHQIELLGSGGKTRPNHHVWGGKSGWFSASYGPYRRFTGGNESYETIFLSQPRLASHLSVFDESVALTETVRWLQDLQFKKLEKQREGALLDSLKGFINQKEFLPHQAQLQEVSSRGIEFVDGNGCPVAVEELSDGYRSILSMTFELIRQLARTYGPDHVFDENDPTKVIAPGVVLIDEVDVHLHPTWQRRVGLWFREHFPNLQFIVTTHSPLVCQAAEAGTVFRLPKPGSDESGGMVSGVDLDRLLYGNVLDAYGTELFGEDITRSEQSKKLLQRLAELNRKELHGQLSRAERDEQKRLRASLPTSAHTLNNLDEGATDKAS